jgi:long-chain acyl-CoA synthetase
VRTHFPQNLSDLPAEAAQRFGNRAALVTPAGVLGFEDIERRVACLAGGLTEIGIGRGDRVILHLPNSWEWIVAYYAVARISGVIVPANILLVAEEVRFMARDCGAAAVIAPEERIAALSAAPAPASVEHYVAVGGSVGRGTIGFESLLRASPMTDRASSMPDDVSTIGYTSGTTGQPKGAALTHRAVILNTAMTANMHVRTVSDVVVTALPCPHVYGNVVMNATFLCGSRLILLARFNVEDALAAIEAHHATMFEGVPTMYYDLLASDRLGYSNHRSLTRCSVGGQTMTLTHMQELERKLGCPLLELWGMTEIAGLGTTHAAYAPGPVGSIGLPLPSVECSVAALDDCERVLAAGETGELMVRGPTVMQGYWANEAATRQVLREDGWMHTGDVAYRDPAGYYFIVDRKKDMINTAGYKVYPSELERVIAELPAVVTVAVGAADDARKGEIAKAYVVLRAGATCSEQEILAHCRSFLAVYKVPRAVVFVHELPKTSTGKILRRALHTLGPQGG